MLAACEIRVPLSLQDFRPLLHLWKRDFRFQSLKLGEVFFSVRLLFIPVCLQETFVLVQLLHPPAFFCATQFVIQPKILDQFCDGAEGFQEKRDVIEARTLQFVLLI